MLLVTSALIVAASALAGAADPLAPLDKALEAMATFEHGGDSGPLRTIEGIVIAVAKDPQQRGLAEERLIKALAAAKTRDAKDFLCRQLRTIGTAKSVPALEPLLADRQLGHMARSALGRIEAPEAAAALHRALGTTQGTLRVGLINTLAARRCERARADIVRLLGSSDAEAAAAAASALGLLGGADAVRALQAARAKASAKVAPRVDDALMACAEQLLAAGQAAEAARIYETFHAPQAPKRLRLGAFRGLVAARGAEGAKLLVEGIKSDDPLLRATAIGLASETKGQEATKTLAGLLPSLAPEGQELLVRALGRRGDAVAMPAIVAATKSESEVVRAAAAEALGGLGDPSAVPLLVQVAAAGGREQQIARRSLTRLGGEAVDAALVKLAAGAGDAKARVEAIRALAARGAGQAVGPMLKLARGDDETVRREAIRTLGTLVGPDRLPLLIELAVKPRDAKDRSAIESAVGAVLRRMNDKAKQAGPVLAALARAPAEAKPTLLRLLGRLATPAALEAVRAAVKDKDEAIRDAAVRSLAAWPTPEPADDLLALARTSTVAAHKVLALRGYVRMAGESKDPTAMFVRAIELAERPEEKRLILSGLVAVEPDVALRILEPYLADENLRDEAAMAAVQIADRVREKDKARARAIVAKVLAAVDDVTVREKAQEVVNAIEQYEGYIREWLVSPHYQQKGKDARALFGIAFPPEQPDAKDVKWTKLTKGIGSWEINLSSAVGGINDVAVYLRTRVWSPAEQDVQLELGSDDAIKVWLGGKAIHANNTDRGIAPRQDIAKARLAKGWNDLVLKVINHGGGWAAACRIRKPGGAAIDGLKYEAK